MRAYIQSRFITRSVIFSVLLFSFVAAGVPAVVLAAAPGEAPPAQEESVLQMLMPTAKPDKAVAPESVKIEGLGVTCPPEYVPLVQRMVTALMSENFTFYPVKGLDPFVPFIAPVEAVQTQIKVSPEDEGELQEGQRPLTPLQKMSLTEVESGLKAITWGDLGRRAVIEDSTGKGYIVAVGTPVGERNGVVTQILNDRVIIQQEFWDKKAKQKVPQDFVVKLSKKTAEK